MSADPGCPRPPRPKSCRRHRLGSAAAIACAASDGQSCAAGAAPAQPATAPAATTLDQHRRALIEQAFAAVPTPEPGEVGDVSESLRQALVRSDRAYGWANGCARPHPAGGYSRWSLSDGALGPRLAYEDEQGRHHRADGPALVFYDRAGRPTGAHWLVRDVAHRSDGPADVTIASDESVEELLFHHRADHEGEIVLFNEGGDEVTLARHHELGEGGLEPEQVIAWMLVERFLDRGEVEEVRAAGADPALVHQALLAGADRDQTQTLIEVGCGSLPLSWAIAGLDR